MNDFEFGCLNCPFYDPDNGCISDSDHPCKLNDVPRN